MAHYIYLEDIRLFTNHGCLSEEERIGSGYRVDLKIKADLSTSSYSDNLSDTIDYVDLNQIVKEEMKVRSKLLEHVGQRIVDRIFKEHAAISKVWLSVAKLNPPIGGDMKSVQVQFKMKRKK